MKHRIFGKKLGRNHHERQALFRSLTRSMFTHGSINTTEAKAKAIIPEIERLASVIVSKEELTAKRELYRSLQDQNWVNNVVKTFKSVFADKKSNFTQTVRIKRRYGDDALIVNLSFVKPIKFSTKKEMAEVVEAKAAKKSVKAVKPVKKAKVAKETK